LEYIIDYLRVLLICVGDISPLTVIYPRDIFAVQIEGNISYLSFSSGVPIEGGVELIAEGVLLGVFDDLKMRSFLP